MKHALVIGDIHGDRVALEEIISKAKSKHKDIELYSVGDMIDRGPDSKGVIQLCIDEDIKSISGNHEIWFKQFIKTGAFEKYCLEWIMGGKATIKSYIGDWNDGDWTDQTAMTTELEESIPEDHKDFISNLPLYRKLEMEGKNYWLSHTGLKKTSGDLCVELGKREGDFYEIISTLEPGNWLWSGAKFISPNGIRRSGQKEQHNLYTFSDPSKDIQIFGHTIFPEAKLADGIVALDTGCGTKAPYRLTGIILPTMEIITSENDWA